MRIDRLTHRLFFFTLAAMVGSTSLAFEPGTKRICKPSADGQSFECVDPTGAKDEPPPAPGKAPNEKAAPPPSARAAATPPRVAESPPAATGDAPKPASELPNYLRQGSNAGSSAPARTPTPKPAAQTKPDPAADPVAAKKPISVSAPVATAKPEPTPTPAPAPAPAPAPEESAQPSSAPARVLNTAPVAASQPAVKAPVPTQVVPAAASPDAEQQTSGSLSSPAKPSPSAAKPSASTRSISGPAKSSRRSLPGASEFGRLPADHYTLELSSARNAAALDPLIDSLDGLSGQLYLIRLNMPDGIWYSLCWSDFGTLEGARDARKALPSDAAITAGWPRRIGLLQGEIAP